MDISIINEVVDISHKRVYCDMEIYNPQKNLANAEFWLQPIYLPKNYHPKQCGMRIYLKGLKFEKYYSDAIQHMFQYLRQFSVEFRFKALQPSLQRKIVLEIGYPVLGQEVMPLLSCCKDLRIRKNHLDANDTKWEHNHCFIESSFERLDSMQSFHIAASLNSQNMMELNRARKTFHEAEALLLSIINVPVPYLDSQEPNSFFGQHGYESLLSVHSLQKYLNQIRAIQKDFFFFVEERPCNSVSFSAENI